MASAIVRRAYGFIVLGQQGEADHVLGLLSVWSKRSRGAQIVGGLAQ
jgi:hypothetical protein